uniref:Uncharacterized protein n=1 Tax=Panagrellus redivivus TaxID=6233 RepID=A0A7E4VBB7_PANRE
MKTANQNCAVITTIFNIIIRLRSIPALWKTLTTILIYKNYSTDDLNNWRQIALSNTHGKLFLSCASYRLTDLCLTNHRLTNTQIGFMKFGSCLERNFVHQFVIHDAWQRSQTTASHLAWISGILFQVPHTP